MERRVLGQEFSSWLWAQARGKEREEGQPASPLAGLRVPLRMRGDMVGSLWHFLLHPETFEELVLASQL